MAGVESISFKGENILLIDNTDLTWDMVVQNTILGIGYVKQVDQNELLMLLDMRGVPLTRRLDHDMRDLAKDAVPLARKTAIVGMARGAKKWVVRDLCRILKKEIKAFDTVEEAKEWLVSGLK